MAGCTLYDVQNHGKRTMTMHPRMIKNHAGVFVMSVMEESKQVLRLFCMSTLDMKSLRSKPAYRSGMA
jgi:hypothetical protein